MTELRVLHIMSGFGGGIAAFIANKAKALEHTNVIFDVMTFDEVDKDFTEAILNTNGKIYHIENPKVVGFRKFYRQVNEVMRNLPNDTFVHCHIRGERMIPFYLIAKRNSMEKFGVHAHTTGPPEEINSNENRLMRKINTTFSDALLSCGKAASTYLFGENYVLDKQVMHIPNSIDPTEFIHDNGNKTKEINDKVIIGHIGRFRDVKNHPFMLEIIKELNKTGLEYEWLFIGTGDNFEKVKQDIIKEGLSSRVSLLGRRDDIPELLKKMDFLMLPSKYEGFPTTVIEAQAAGTRSILSDTITNEVDLELNLIDFLSIDSPKRWADYILNHLEPINIQPELRLQRLESKKMTNNASAELYKEFLSGNITHYEM